MLRVRKAERQLRPRYRAQFDSSAWQARTPAVTARVRWDKQEDPADAVAASSDAP